MLPPCEQIHAMAAEIPETAGARFAWLWARPDSALTAAGVEGERLVARVRLAALALLLISPTLKLLLESNDAINRWGFVVTAVAALAALAIWWMLRRGRWRPWIGFVSSAIDVSLVTTALVTFMVVGTPLDALNSKVTFEMYFLAITATSLRYDARICLSVGLLAWLQYAGLWAYAATHFDLHDPVHLAGVGAYSPIDQLTRLILLGVMVLLALNLVHRAQRLLHLGARDRLTGLYNRGHFDRALQLEFDRSTRYQRPSALAILDIDHFKQVNDHYGHPLGDRVLRTIADRLAAGVRRTDLVARYGGEEFVVLFPETTRGNALARIEALRCAIAENPLELGDGRTLAIGFSAGIAAFPEDPAAINPDSLLACADVRLLAAKRAGRARSVAHDEQRRGTVRQEDTMR
jgi:diguanylate cyclase (GGDEF)-like protein